MEKQLKHALGHINADNEDLYIIVTFPDIQDYMVHPDFRDHAFLINDWEGYKKYGDSAYFVELEWANSQEVIDYINVSKIGE